MRRASDDSVHVRLDHLNTDSPVRCALDDAHVARLAEVLEACPAVSVTEAGELLDGMHRVAAARLRGWIELPAVVVQVTGEVGALVEAARLNSRHGLPLTGADRRAAARRLIELTDLSDRAIANVCGLGRQTLSALRSERTSCSGGLESQSESRIGRDGRHHPLQKGSRGRLADALVRLDPTITVRKLADAVGVSVGAAHGYRLAARQRMEAERWLVRVWRRLWARWVVWRLFVGATPRRSARAHRSPLPHPGS